MPKKSRAKFLHYKKGSNDSARTKRKKALLSQIGLASVAKTYLSKIEVRPLNFLIKPNEIISNKGNDLRNFHRCIKCTYETMSVFAIENHTKWSHNRATTLFDCTNSAPEMYKCDACDFQTYFIISFNEHVRVGHALCSENRTKKSYHLYPILFMKSYNCKDCHFETFSKLVLANHQCGSHVKNENVFKLANLFNDPVKFYQIFKKIGLFDCKQCSFQATARYILQQHVIRKHADPGDRWFKCECKFRTQYKQVLMSHIVAQHTTPADVMWCKCELCSVPIKYRDNLIEHLFKKHTTFEIERWIQCQQCSYKTRNEYSLELHTKAEHATDHVGAKYINPEDASVKYEIFDDIKIEDTALGDVEHTISGNVKIEQTCEDDIAQSTSSELEHMFSEEVSTEYAFLGDDKLLM